MSAGSNLIAHGGENASHFFDNETAREAGFEVRQARQNLIDGR